MKKITFFLSVSLTILSCGWLIAANGVDVNPGQSAAPLVVETETGKTYRGADVQDCATCSNAKHVGNIGGPTAESGYLVSTVTVEKTGSYKMNLSFISGNPRAIFISANGQTPVETTVNSGGWDVVSTKEIEIQLVAGTNSIKFYNYTSYGPNVDKFTLTLFQEAPACVTCLGPYEAEASVIFAPAAIQDCETCSGGKQVGDMGYSNRYFTSNVTIVTPGTYRIYVSYSSGAARSLSITANDVTTVTSTVHSIDWGVVFVKSFDIVLQAGSNTLKFHTPGDWGPNIDKFSLEFRTGLSVLSNALPSFAIYPNPSKNNWNLKSENAKILKIDVLDINGRTLISNKPNNDQYTIDGSTLTKGLYFAKVESDNGNQVIKIIKD